MNQDRAVLLFIIIPLIVVWVGIVVDIALQPRMSGVTKALWVTSFILVWPMIVYVLTRPNRGRVERYEGRRDPHAQLVAAVLDHEAGRLDSASFDRIVGDLRAGRAAD